QSVRAAADTFDELTAFGEQIDRRAAAAAALTALAEAYADYARAVLAARSRSVVSVVQEESRLRTAVQRAEETLAGVEERQEAARATLTAAEAGVAADEARLATLRDSPEFRDQRRLGELAQQARRDAELARDADARAERARTAPGRPAGARDRAREGPGWTLAQLSAGVRTTADGPRRRGRARDADARAERARTASGRTAGARDRAREELGWTLDQLSAGVRTTADGLRRLVRDVSLTTTLTAQSLTDEPGTVAVVAGGLVAG